MFPSNMDPQVLGLSLHSTTAMPVKIAVFTHFLLFLSNSYMHKFNLHIIQLTCPKRLWWWFGWLKPLFFWPLTVSNKITPKLNTSDLTENFPSIAYSGDIYPLHKFSNFKHLETNRHNIVNKNSQYSLCSNNSFSSCHHLISPKYSCYAKVWNFGIQFTV